MLSLLAVILAAPLAAQDSTAVDRDLPPETEPIDVQVLRTLYAPEAGAYPLAMQIANESAYPTYYSATPLLLGATLLTDADTRPAVRLAITQIANFGTTRLLKNIVQRPRPYVALDDVDARDREHQGDEVFDPHSFPSGHTSSAFAIATSLSASYPEWYVIAPAMTWATAVGVSRVWLGVHYPSDVLVGAGIGAGTALLVAILLPDSEPEGELVPLDGVEPVPVFSFSIPIR
ncbi:MAG: phosphatase PAP2 family protein [Bacteroidota bacterium]